MESPQTLMVAALPRTGSHMLCSALRETGVAGKPHEYFNEDRFVHPANLSGVVDLRVNPLWTRPIFAVSRALGHPHLLPNRVERSRLISGRAMKPYLGRIRTSTATPNGVFSTSVHWHQWELVTRIGHLVPADLGPRTTWVRLVRRDRLAQAISFHRAQQTGAWVSKLEREDRVAAYDADAIATAFDEMVRSDDGWAAYFARWDITPIDVTYERLVADPQSVVAEILTALDVRTEVTAAPTTTRQSGAESDEWAERFLIDRPEYAARRLRPEPV